MLSLKVTWHTFQLIFCRKLDTAANIGDLVVYRDFTARFLFVVLPDHFISVWFCNVVVSVT